MPTDFNDLAYFGITNVQMNGKCWNQGVTFSSRTIFHFEQCEWPKDTDLDNSQGENQSDNQSR